MTTRFRSRWQKIKQHRVAFLVGAIILIVASALIFLEVWFYGTGFDGYNTTTMTYTLKGTSVDTVTRTVAYQQGKTL